jgi:predicted phage baseplate assembly protein
VGTRRQNVLRFVPGKGTLLTGDAFTRAVAAETDERGRATMRFGDDVNGMAPADESFIGTTYRIGVGRAGMVGAEALTHVIPQPVSSVLERLASPGTPPPTANVDIVEVRNPLAAWGGVDPEPVEEVKRLAPDAYRAVPMRAVTEADYGAAAELLDEVQRAVATFRWTGSWHTVYLTVDPRGTTALSPELRARVLDHVARYTQTGYDLELNAPIYAALELEIHVCADREHFRTDVEAAVLRALSSRRFPSGETGFFHPDRFTFGEPLYLSALYAAIEDVDGVDSATVLRFSRTTDEDPVPTRPVTARNVDRGLIPAARLEVLRCENNPSLPENGLLRLVMGGGK